jgi:ApaG protein
MRKNAVSLRQASPHNFSGMARPFYYSQTDGIRVTVRPQYVPEQSQPALRQYVFAYHVRIENVGSIGAQLLARRWLIHDDAGQDTEVVGDGVVGLQPVLAPGRVHEYQSFCVLKAPSGFMEGEYRFRADDGSSFEARIPRFYLQRPE